MSTIVIDPGHGGNHNDGGSSWNNAKGPSGTLERAVTLDLGLRVTERLRAAGHDVRMTRDTDVNLGLAARAAVARNSNAAAFLSIHFNGWNDPDTQGTETWVHTTNTVDSRTLAASVQQRIVAATGYANRGVRSKGLGVLSLANQSPGTAACLVEVSFLTDPDEETRLRDEDYRDRVAEALARGITDYLAGATSGPATPIPSGDPNGDGDA